MDSIIKGVLLVAFVVICVLLVLLVLVQDQDNSGMGGLLGGGNSAAFGSHSASVLTKATVVFVVLFFVVTFAIAKVLPTKSDSNDADMRAAAEASGAVMEDKGVAPEASDGKWWDDSAKAETTETAAEISEAAAN
ncbi:preprotein translocase subunit SecG [uncultured Treponema sp.]|uniref:preprotein translocase subunit SecG n=1 Tax=uncultured Treponema sp. TaxID=162155 RepID=UPI0025E70189|nr:preprotein translocase subunit SecG [uncultured Treponema sp.]